MKRFYHDPYLHIRSFITSLALAAALCALLYSVRPPEFLWTFEPQLWHALLIPLGIYVGGISAVFIHNATHGSFKGKLLNEFCGTLAGIHQLWGYMGWKFIHLMHHHYSDNIEMDPHPPKGKSFAAFTRDMFIKSSAKVSERYREHWGMTRRTRILHHSLLVIFISMAICHLAFWYLLLGPVGFVFFYIPSYIYNHFIFSHINYYAHPENEAGNTEAANLNHNWYYKLSNMLFCGIYFHGNHHRKPLLFNPRKMPARTSSPSHT